jgi:hypothetical protein
VTAQHVLRSVRELQRRGSTPVLSELEQLEPDLIEHLLEGLTQVHRKLADFGLSGQQTRKVYRLAESTALVCLMALRQAHHDLWAQDVSDPDPVIEPLPSDPAIGSSPPRTTNDKPLG